MRIAALVAFMALLTAGAVAGEVRVTGGIVDTTTTSTGIAPYVSVTYQVRAQRWLVSPAVSWSAVRKEVASGGSGNWTGSGVVSRFLGDAQFQPFVGVGGSYTYTDSATWTKRVSYGSAHVGLRRYATANRYQDSQGGRLRDYADFTLIGSYELTSTYANDTRGLAFVASLNEYVGHGWFLITEGSIGIIRYHPSPYDQSWQDSGTIRAVIGFARR